MFHQDRIGPLYQLKICKRNNQQESPVNRAEAAKYKPEKDEEQKLLTSGMKLLLFLLNN